jgi:predicted CopG family antitoxin
MSSVNVRISAHSYQVLKSLSKDGRNSMQSVIDQAIEDLRRRKFLEAANAAFSELKANAEEWNEELKERELWETTLMDGLNDE